MQRPVIVVPGYYGSRLADRITGGLVWLTGRSLLRPDATLRALRFEADDPDRLVSAGILEEVPLVLPFWDVKVYEGLLDFLHGNLELPWSWILPFHYDWRRSIEHAADLLADQILRLVAVTGSEEVDVVAHSLGGLVARACLAKHDLAARVRWLVTLGAPHKGMLRTFQMITEGADLFTFPAADVREAARGFPSAYELLPNDADDGLFVVGGAERTAFESDEWAEGERMQRLLEEASEVVSDLLSSELPVDSCLVHGTRLETLTGAAADDDGEVDFSSSDDGDGTVPRISAAGRGLDGDRVLRFPVPLGIHSQLPSDEFVQQAILTPLLLGRPFPDVLVEARFRQQPFFIPRSKNPLAVVVVGPEGEPVADATVELTIVGSAIRDREVPFDSGRGDYGLNVTMPGPSAPHRLWRLRIVIPGRSDIVRTGLLVRAA